MTTAELARREQITPQAMGATIASLEQLRPGGAQRGCRRRAPLDPGPDPGGPAAVRSGRSAVVDRIAAVLEESFTDEEIEILAAAAPLIERLADLL